MVFFLIKYGCNHYLIRGFRAERWHASYLKQTGHLKYNKTFFLDSLERGEGGSVLIVHSFFHGSNSTRRFFYTIRVR